MIPIDKCYRAYRVYLALLKVVTEDGPSGVRKIAHESGYSQQTTRNYLNFMIAAGVVTADRAHAHYGKMFYRPTDIRLSRGEVIDKCYIMITGHSVLERSSDSPQQPTSEEQTPQEEFRQLSFLLEEEDEAKQP